MKTRKHEIRWESIGKGRGGGGGGVSPVSLGTDFVEFNNHSPGDVC